jgi:hypothetical protein
MLSLRTLGAGASLLALGAILAARPSTTMPAGTERSDPVAALVARYDSGWNRKDTVAVGRMMAARYQYFTSRGALTPRASMLEFLGSPEYKLERAERSEVEVTHTGPVAVVSSRWKGNGTYRGRPFVDDQRCGLVWLRTGQRWELVSEHCVQIQPGPRPASE